MFTADVPGVARSASGEMARTAESRLCRERRDRGSGRRDLVFVNREVRGFRERRTGRLVSMPEGPDRLPRALADALGLEPDAVTLTTHELVPPRRHAVALPDLGALRDRFRPS